MDSGNLVLLVLGVGALALVAYLVYKNRAIKGKLEVGPLKAELESNEALSNAKQTVAETVKPAPINMPTPPNNGGINKEASNIVLPKINTDSASMGSVLNAVQSLMNERGEINTKALRTFIAERFSLAEMAQLCADMNIDFESIAGNTKEAKALELVQYCTRRGQLHDLVAMVIDARA